jgi:hypothetical protein
MRTRLMSGYQADAYRLPDRADRSVGTCPQPGYRDDLGVDLAESVPGFPVDGIVILAAEPVIPDAGRMRHRGIDIA